jgi:hypothetical protein
VLVISLASAVTLDSGTILNTTSSNSSITFSNTIVVSSVILEENNVTLNDITCEFGNPSMYDSFFWNTTNSNIDSVIFCGLDSFYKLNSNNGTIAYDSSGNANH